MIKCLAVNCVSQRPISLKAFVIELENDKECILPYSQYYGDVKNSGGDTIWLSDWIVEKKGLEPVPGMQAFYDEKTSELYLSYTVERHTPDPVEPLEHNFIDELHK